MSVLNVGGTSGEALRGRIKCAQKGKLDKMDANIVSLKY